MFLKCSKKSINIFEENIQRDKHDLVYVVLNMIIQNIWFNITLWNLVFSLHLSCVNLLQIFYPILKKQLFQWFEMNSLEVLFYTTVATVLLCNDYLIIYIYCCLCLLRNCINIRILDFCGKEHKRNRSNDTSMIEHLCLKITVHTIAVRDVVFLRRINILHVPSEKSVQQKFSV